MTGLLASEKERPRCLKGRIFRERGLGKTAALGIFGLAPLERTVSPK